MEARGEKLLQDLVGQEKTLMVKLDEAKKEAAQIIEKAQAEASSIIAKAREKSQTALKDQQEKTQAEADAEREEILGGIRSDVDALEKQSKKNTDKAVQLVMERVLP